MIKYNGNREEIRMAVEFFMSERRLIESSISSHQGFQFTGYMGSTKHLSFEFSWTLNSCDIKVVIKRPWWRWTKAIAWTKKGDNNIYLNHYRIKNRSVSKLAGTIAHEFGHIMSNNDKKYSYGHGNNSSIGKERSFQYWLGDLVEGLYDEK